MHAHGRAHRQRRPANAMMRANGTRGRARLAKALLFSIISSAPPPVFAKPLPTTLPVEGTTSINFRNEDYTSTIPTEYGLLTGATSFAVTNTGVTGKRPPHSFRFFGWQLVTILVS